MLAKMWKKIGLVILITACIFNIMSKLVGRLSINEELVYSVKYMLQHDEKNK